MAGQGVPAGYGGAYAKAMAMAGHVSKTMRCCECRLVKKRKFFRVVGTLNGRTVMGFTQGCRPCKEQNLPRGIVAMWPSGALVKPPTEVIA